MSEETEEAKISRRREEDFYDWVHNKEQNSNYREAKEWMRDHADNGEYCWDHFDRNESQKEYEERKLEEWRGEKY